MARVRAGVRSRTSVEESDNDECQPLYAAALLRLALRLRRTEPSSRPDWDDLVEQALGRSRIPQLDRDAFRGYLERNYSFLLALLGRKNSVRPSQESTRGPEHAYDQ
jgi:hypothetical protein